MSERPENSGVFLRLLGDKRSHEAFALSCSVEQISHAVQASILAERITFVAGVSGPLEIFEACSEIRSSGRRAVVLIDAFETTGGQQNRQSILDTLDKDGFQFLTIEGALSLLRSTNQFVYPYAKAEVSTSVIAIAEKQDQVLLIKRDADPYRGFFALPGGFLRPLVETMEQCACRELLEETGLHVVPEQLKLVSVRSELDRDTRGQVIDHNYLVSLPTFEGLNLKAADDAAKLTVVSVEEAMNLTLAADHSKILRDAICKYRKESGFFKRLAIQANQIFRFQQTSRILEA